MADLIYNIQPDEIYHLGAHSHVRVSFDMSEYTGDVTGIWSSEVIGSSSEDWGKDQVLPGII